MNREFQTLSPQTRQELCEVMDIMETELTVEEIREQLEMTQKGAVKNNRHNCKLILEHDPLLKDVFRHNILTEQTDIVKPVWWERISPAFTDMDLNYIMLYLEETYGLTMDKIVQKSIVHQADRNKYHPVRDYLNSLQWDGQERIRYVLHHFLGAPVDELTYETKKCRFSHALTPDQTEHIFKLNSGAERTGNSSQQKHFHTFIGQLIHRCTKKMMQHIADTFLPRN